MTPRGALSPVYRTRRAPPNEGEALEIAVGAILTQNTAWTNVERALRELHRARAMALGPLLRLPRRRLERLIRSSGYFRQKALKLRAFLSRLKERGGSLRRWLSGDLGAVRAELLGLYGIGPETADSILLYAGSRPAFVVDAYTLRIGGRLGWWLGADYPSAQSYLTRRLPRSVPVYEELHALLVALAKYYCRPEPLCGACPLASGCRRGKRRETASSAFARSLSRGAGSSSLARVTTKLTKLTN